MLPLLITKSQSLNCFCNIHSMILYYCRSCVRVVSSNRTGMGKSLFIQRMANQLGVITNDSTKSTPVVIPIHGPVATADVVLNFLKDHYKEDKCKIYHFDIAPSVSAYALWCLENKLTALICYIISRFCTRLTQFYSVC